MSVAYNLYTEASAGGSVVPLAAGEHLLSLDVFPDGNAVGITIVGENVESATPITVPASVLTWSRQWESGARTPIHGPGSITFGSLGSAKFLVVTSKSA